MTKSCDEPKPFFTADPNAATVVIPEGTTLTAALIAAARRAWESAYGYAKAKPAVDVDDFRG